MRKNSNDVLPTFKDEVVKQQEVDQPARSDQDSIGSTSVASRSAGRRARRIYQHPERLHDRAARHPKWKRPNALKHGLYSGVPLIPGEDPRQFNKLHADLIKEWQPSGPTLRFALRRLADSMWCMGRLEKLTQTRLSLTRLDPQGPTFDEIWGFIMFVGYLQSEPEKDFEDQAKKYLRPDKIKHLREKFPRSNYQSTSEWAKAITNEILLVWSPEAPGLEPPEPEAKPDYLKELARQWRADQQVAGCMVLCSDVLEFYSKEAERLEARIVRQVRRCAELKVMEEIRNKK